MKALSQSKTTTNPVSGFTLAEVLVATVVSLLTIAAVLNGYVMSARRTEWSVHSLAAHSLAMQRLEQVRSAKWDTGGYPPVDEAVTSRFPKQTNVLDIPLSGNKSVYGTNFTTISTISNTPPIKMIKVDCVWRFQNGRLYTNTVVTYRTSDT